MQATRRGGDRQDLHERIRQHAVAAADRLKEEGGANDLPRRIAGDPAFGMTEEAVEESLRPERHVGRAPEQVDAFLADIADILEEARRLETAAPDLRA